MKNLILVAAFLLGSSALADHHEKKTDKKMAKAAVNCDKVKEEDKKACMEKMNATKHEDGAKKEGAEDAHGH